MDASLEVPTATSVRSVPVKLLFDNRIVINNHLARARGGKVSFTHLIGWAVIRALIEARTDPVLFRMSRDYVGDTAETVSLLWPEPDRPVEEPPLTVAEAVDRLMHLPRSDAPAALAAMLD